MGKKAKQKQRRQDKKNGKVSSLVDKYESMGAVPEFQGGHRGAGGDDYYQKMESKRERRNAIVGDPRDMPFSPPIDTGVAAPMDSPYGQSHNPMIDGMLMGLFKAAQQTGDRICSIVMGENVCFGN